MTNKERLEKRVYELLPESKQSLYQQQLSKIPHRDLGMFYQYSTEYLVDGTRTLVEDDCICLELNYLKIRNLIPPKYIHDFLMSRIPMLKIIKQKVIEPFLLFIGGRFIKWSNIDVLIQYDRCYLIIKNMGEEYSEILSSIDRWDLDIKIITIPCLITYSEEGIKDDNPILFKFDENGYHIFNDEDEPSIVITNKDPSLMIKEWHIPGFINLFDLDIDRNFKIFKDNLMVFKNQWYLDQTTYSINILSTIVTVDSYDPYEGNVYTLKLFYNTDCHLAHDNINKIDKALLIQYAKLLNGVEDEENIDLKDSFEGIIKEFDIYVSNRINYNINVSKSLTEMLDYNSDLFNHLYTSTDNFEIYQVTGEWIQSRLNPNDGGLAIPRRHYKESNGYVIMFVNGELYKHYYTHKYYANLFIIGIDDIESTDIVEFMFFKNVNNYVLDITIPEGGEDFTLYHDKYRNTNLSIFSQYTNENYFLFPIDGLQSFKVDYNIEFNEDGESRITVDNPFYYNKPLTVVYNNRFKYYSYTAPKIIADTSIRIELGEEFKYCYDMSKYMVFVNHRRVSPEKYRLVLPLSSTTPFNQYNLYFTFPIQENDCIDVFYVPIIMQDVPKDNVSIDADLGLIYTTLSSLNYNLSKDYCLFWVNGKKVPETKLVDVDRILVQLNEDTNSTYDLCITKYVEDIDNITDYFRNNLSEWVKFVHNLLYKEPVKYNILDGQDYVPITDTEPKYAEDTYTLISVIWEIVRDHFLSNPSLNMSEEFIYNYLNSPEIEKAEGGLGKFEQLLIPVMEAEREDAIPTTREYP